MQVDQDYTNPDYFNQERDKIAMEVVNAFKPQLERMFSDCKFAYFLYSRGLYTGPYADTPEERLEHFKKVAEQTGANYGPRYTASLDGVPKVFVPGMAKHAWNAGAVDQNARRGGWSQEFADEYKGGAKKLERMAWAVSQAIDGRNLNHALTLV
ncbi:MAG: hypothetical protein DI551_12070, partial [Micavibrio aeruginosavorus]